MLAIYELALAAEAEINKIPQGQPIDFIMWPIMAAAFAAVIYFVHRAAPEEGNKDEEK
jgi:hypothetical protein